MKQSCAESFHFMKRNMNDFTQMDSVYKINHSHQESMKQISKTTLRLDSGYESDPDESDHFEVTNLETSTSLDEPGCVSPDSPWSAGTSPVDIQATLTETRTSSEVYIYHERADSNLGDKFGASVLTDTSFTKDGYFRHFFVKVKSGFPSITMDVKNDDEIVLINDRFVPDLNHEAIMTLIRKVPVDGVTRFKLVLRRLKNLPSERKWIWFETSALLVPEFSTEPRQRRPRAEEVEKIPLNNMWNKITYQRYRVIGTQKYLGISAKGVNVDVLTENLQLNQTKTVCKHAMVTEDPRESSRFRFVTSLGCADKRFFVALNENTNGAYVTRNEVFFDYREYGQEIYFQQNEVYLSCLHDKVCASKDRFVFEELPSPGHKDVCDMGFNADYDIDVDIDDVDGSNEFSHGIRPAENRSSCVNPNNTNTSPFQDS